MTHAHLSAIDMQQKSGESHDASRRSNVADARAVIRADYSADRRDFLAQKLALLDEVTKKAAESNQLNAVIGATRLSAELAQLV